MKAIKRVAVELLSKLKAKIAEFDYWTDKQETKATFRINVFPTTVVSTSNTPTTPTTPSQPTTPTIPNKPSKVSLFSVLVIKMAPAFFTWLEKRYSNGFQLSDYGTRATFNLKGEYSTLEFDLGHIDDSGDEDLYLEILLDGEVSETFEMSRDDLPEHHKISVSGAKQMIIRSGYQSGRGIYAIVNIMLS